MSNGTLIGLLGLGLILGLRHALDPDHIAAVSTIVSESRSVRRSSLIGTCWGLGHTMSLLVAGVLVIALKIQISDRLALWMEFAVALMLILLGLKAVLKPLRGWRIHAHQHAHGGSSHSHVHLHRPSAERAHQHRHLIRSGAPPFFVGMVHGMAGGAALMTIVLAAIAPELPRLSYVAS